MTKVARAFFFGNLFYGLCTVSLSIETNLQLGIALNRFPFYLLVFLATIVYYGRIYYKTSFHISSDARSAWFRNHQPLIRIALIVCSVGILLDVLYMIAKNFRVLVEFPPVVWLIVALVPVIGLLYTSRLFSFRNLRQVGWLKPFIIGFVWAGVVTVFPFFFWQVKHPVINYGSLLLPLLFWLQNFLFITALAVVFDIKDYPSDKNLGLLTIPARIGAAATLRLFIIPMCLLSFAVLTLFHLVAGFPISHTILQAVPYIALLLLVRNLATRKNLLFYLAAIDGLMFLKAVCGIISITLL